MSASGEDAAARLKDYALCDIDWTLTPERAVAMYLEWGNNAWDGERPPVRSKNDVSLYFVVDSWQEPPVVRLVKRSMEHAEELLSVPLPAELADDFRAENGHTHGISAPTESILAWLRRELGQD